jgi:hypothetical protein
MCWRGVDIDWLIFLLTRCQPFCYTFLHVSQMCDQMTMDAGERR